MSTATDRRSLLTAALAAIAGPRARLPDLALPAKLRESPWAARAKELEPTDGHYADYIAFKDWLQKRVNEVTECEPGSRCDHWASPLDAWCECEYIAMYSIMFDLVATGA